MEVNYKCIFYRRDNNKKQEYIISRVNFKRIREYICVIYIYIEKINKLLIIFVELVRNIIKQKSSLDQCQKIHSITRFRCSQ